jgi:hypothetical protein
MDPKMLDLAALALAAAFGAGAYAFALRMTRKQMNGLGARVTRVVMAVIHICPAEKREEVIRIMLGEGKGHS